MAFTPPTIADFTALFPAFAQVEQSVLSMALEQAQGFVDQSWCNQADFTNGILFKMGEWLVSIGQDAAGSGASAVAGDLKKFKSGEASYERFTADELSNGETTTGLPDFAALYDALLRRNRGGPYTTAFY